MAVCSPEYPSLLFSRCTCHNDTSQLSEKAIIKDNMQAFIHNTYFTISYHLKGLVHRLALKISFPGNASENTYCIINTLFDIEIVLY